MDARNDETTVDVAVIGAGLAGLAAAATAADAGRSVLLIDGQPGGGRAATDEVGRYRFNRGAHALYTTGPGRTVLNDLGVQVKGSPPVLRGAMVRVGHRVGLAPGNAVSLARTPMLSSREKLVLGRLLAGVRRWRPDEWADRSAAQFFDHLGLEGRPRQMVMMLTRTATYGADPEVLSADVVISQVQMALAGVEYLHGGWRSLVDGLAAAGRDRGVRPAPGVHARRVEPDGDGTRVRVELDDGTVHARRVVLAAGSPGAAERLLPDGAAGWGPQGPAARIACLDLGLWAPPSIQVLFGVDVPLYLSCHAPAAAGLAPPGAATAQLMWYLRPDEDPTPDEARGVLADHARLAGIDAGDAVESRYLHRMVAVSAQPAPEAGGLRGRPRVTDSGVEGVFLAGDWVGPTGYLADASLVSGAEAAKAAVASLDRPSRSVGEPAA